ncbi:hypothetical protein MAR_014398 [Mya arenaria]|uniref:Uncharacterized protein n=1 Tax=Mya arenaria TaxID=6604 RepID=A0ABY7G5B3_MYAAR|nr:hypothetical protein MAR_014398 [Mya arenaria]
MLDSVILFQLWANVDVKQDVKRSVYKSQQRVCDVSVQVNSHRGFKHAAKNVKKLINIHVVPQPTPIYSHFTLLK